MGSYGIGPARIMAAAVEQRHDEDGIAWPRALAPYDAHVVAIASGGSGADELAEQVAAGLEAEGFSVLYDDRDRRPGEKFADADLIGCPLRVTVGKKTLADGTVDVRERAAGTEQRIPAGELVATVRSLLG
jgi:prolyl-tRNA synthetase